MNEYMDNSKQLLKEPTEPTEPTEPKEIKEHKEGKEEKLSVKDIFHENFTFSKHHLWADLILFCLAAYTYYVGNTEIYTNLLKYIIFVFLLRYILNIITHYTNEETKKTYYQLNSHVALFALLVLLNPVLQFNTYIETFVIISYTLFLSLVKYGYTIDNLMTLLIVKMTVMSKFL
jgi:hypothetical protein